MQGISFIISIFLITSVSSCQTSSSEIKNCFDGFKNSIVNHDGVNGVKLVAKESLEFYAQLLEKAKRLDSSGLIKEPFIVYIDNSQNSTRNFQTRFLTMDGKGLVIASINKEITNNGNIKRSSIGKLQ
jgi:hypothetical protein